MKNLYIVFILNLFCLIGYSQVTGTNVSITIPVPRFDNCLIKEATQQTVFNVSSTVEFAYFI